MNRSPDPLLSQSNADRLHYATGELLGADDFRDEQTYHRRRLAQALLFLNGSGTIAGLRVTALHQPGATADEDEVQLRVLPGLALDRAGRLVEVPRPACLRLRRWYEFIAAQPPESNLPDVGDLRTAFQNNAVVADIFLAFHPCERGYTPAFASGPFDALDASQPSRVRDAYELTLVLRPEPESPAQLPTAFDFWSGIEDTADPLAEAKRRSLSAWDDLQLPAPQAVGDWHENPAGTDPAAVLLARLRIPATLPGDAAQAPAPNWSAATWANDTTTQENPNLENNVRNFILPAAAVRRLAGP
jgi:hypothetical protein